MEEAFMVSKGDDLMDLPPGFRFHPTDEEIITHYLKEKVMNSSFSASAIGEADLNKCEPWDLPKKAKMGEKEWYFFCQRDRKYPTGMRTNRATESGYWKATGKDREIFKGKACLVGMKKTLVFYRGRAPKGEKTNWVMHEYRLEGNFSYYNLTKASNLYSSRLPHTDEWAVCRVFYKNSGIKKSPIPGVIRINSFGNDLLNCPDLLPPLMEAPLPSSSRPAGEDVFKGANTSSSSARLLDENCLSYFSITSPTDHQLQRQQVAGQKTFLLPSNNYTTNTNYQAPNSVFHSQIEIPLWGANFPCQASPDLDYLHKDKDGHCKVEQMSSNQSMVSLSEDTGLSTDVNTDISSVASKPEIGIHRPYEDLQGPSVGPMPDLTFLWDY